MNATTPYEQLMAAKLDQVPVPDMADSIWAGIEMQLDAPGNAPASKPARKFKGAGWYGLGLGAVIAITLWWYFNLPKKQEPLPVAPPAVTPPAVVPPPTTPPPVFKKDTASVHRARADSIHVDTAAKQIRPQLKIDSSFLQRDRPALPDVDLYGPPPPPEGKKHKGVKGITDDDYKISAGKDSARKRN